MLSAFSWGVPIVCAMLCALGGLFFSWKLLVSLALGIYAGIGSGSWVAAKLSLSENSAPYANLYGVLIGFGTTFLILLILSLVLDRAQKTYRFNRSLDLALGGLFGLGSGALLWSFLIVLGTISPPDLRGKLPEWLAAGEIPATMRVMKLVGGINSATLQGGYTEKAAESLNTMQHAFDPPPEEETQKPKRWSTRDAETTVQSGNTKGPTVQSTLKEKIYRRTNYDDYQERTNAEL